MKYLSIESAKILNIGLVDNDICESVKNSLIKECGWEFNYRLQRIKLKGKDDYTINTRVIVTDSGMLSFLDFSAKTNDPLLEALTHIQNHYKEMKIFNQLK